MSFTDLPPKLLKPGSRLRLPEGSGCSDALSLAQLLTGQSRPLVILTASAWHGQRLLEEISWFAPEQSVHLLPDWETLPYDGFSPHQDLISERLATLWHIATGKCQALIVPVATAMYRLAPRGYLAARTFEVFKGKPLPQEAFRSQLTLAGYNHVQQVMHPGEYCVRGGLIDLFPAGSTLPFRIELLDEDVETIRTFDVDTQRTVYPVSEIRLLPAREFPTDESGRIGFRERFRDYFEGDPSRVKIYKDISSGIVPGGIEYFLPLFFDQTETLFDYLPAHALCITHGDAAHAAHEFWDSARSRYEVLKGDRTRPVMAPKDIFLQEDEFFTRLNAWPRFEIPAPAGAHTDHAQSDSVSRQDASDRTEPIVPSELSALIVKSNALPNIEIQRGSDHPLDRLNHFLSQNQNPILLVAESLGRRETISQLLIEHDIEILTCDNWASFLSLRPALGITVGPLAAGFIAPLGAFSILTEAELYATQVRQSRRRDGRQRSNNESMIKDLSEVRLHDPVVHIEHGVGRYMGLLNMDMGEGENEFLQLDYADGDKLYVPVSQLHQISRYTGGPPESAPLHKLGSGQWDKAKRKAAQQVRDTAAELLDLYAKRAARQGFSFPLKESEYAQFASGFPFEETPDQRAAIAAVMDDMGSGRPMDRLICGDVGFGKTEVAMRAAFLAVNAGKQVAVLVPTTLLAEQHFQNFSDRFAEWPVKVAELSRFRSAKETTVNLAGLKAGSIDIVIGTHKLIGEGIEFHNLGLVIIDEEHRFGVRQKERLKALRAEVDVLTLTATPIPRTLAMSMEGLRDFSVIATAPQKRLAIKTFVYPFSESVIQEACSRELKRGGQLYFLHNEVDTIENMRERLTALVPEARIAVAHGQLPERELERVMREFYHQQYNVLLCSTIIETGIDVPTANTIIMHRADKFGLAQLHQLRGRVGRSHHQAYAYLLTPPSEALSAQAKKRLEAIQMMEELGSGFFLAMHDLEIRGAGEVLGDSQSGEIQQIGFGLYAEMLNNAVRAMKKGKIWNEEEPLGVTTEINLHAPALLPLDYCGDVHERLVIYKRLANCDEESQLEEMREELIDRFGLIPDSTQLLLECHRIRLSARRLGIRKVDANGDSIRLQFDKSTTLDPADLIMMLGTHPNWRLDGQDRVRIILSGDDALVRAAQAKGIMKELTHYLRTSS